MIHRIRLAQFVGPGVRYQDYIGPQESIPAGWSIVTRRVVRRSFSSVPWDASLPCAEAGAGGFTQQGDAA